MSDQAPTGPPEAYMANLIANELMRSGASMYGRKEDATCVLKVGTGRYYVHVQLLAARSPTFRRIFDDMIRSNAWGSLSSDVESTTEAYSQSHDDYGDDQDLMDTEGYSMTSYECQSLSESGSVNEGRQSCESGREIRQQSTDDMWSAGHHDNRTYSSASASPWQGYDDDDFGTSFTGNVGHHSGNDMPLIPTTHSSIEQLNVSVRRSMREQEQERDHGMNMDDTDDQLPELTVSFTDPEGCHFDEILYWLYTGDNERWLLHFTPENYESILQNILELRIATKTVLDICLAFEATTHPELGLRGKAHYTFFGPDHDTSTGPLGLHY
ncbi:MAG: hypothetical protein J3Q66DRAFT_436820 [Benniella sp.]|nr:MAG: hypothetical protein J3Q66DRAFT_436820 [Benniella sp.]